MMAYVEMLVQGILGVGSGGVRRGWQYIVQATYDDDIWCMTTTCATNVKLATNAGKSKKKMNEGRTCSFRVIRVDGTTAKRFNGAL